MSHPQTVLLLVDDPIRDVVLVAPPVIVIDDVFHAVELVGVLTEVPLRVGHGGRFEHLVELLVLLMELLLLISFHPHAEGVQRREPLLTLDAVVDVHVFPLKN
jgi:hypothetical protein